MMKILITITKRYYFQRKERSVKINPIQLLENCCKGLRSKPYQVFPYLISHLATSLNFPFNVI